MFTTWLSVPNFLGSGFPTMSGDGFAGLVFLVARSADNPTLQREFLRDWEDLHDLTGRYLAVIVPAAIGWESRNPENSDERLVFKEYNSPDGFAVGGLCAHQQTQHRLRTAILYGGGAHIAQTTRRWEESIGLDVAAKRPGRKEDHRSALTQAASTIAQFFGISELLIPCAVIVSLQEKRVLAVALDETFSVYAFFKRVKQEFEPTTALFWRKYREVSSAREDVESWHRKGEWGTVHSTVRNITGDWKHQRRLVQEDLEGAAVKTAGELSRLCLWMGNRISSEQPLTEQDRADARRLVHLLGSSNRDMSSDSWPYKTLPRRIMHVLRKMESGYPENLEPFLRGRELQEEKSKLDDNLARLKAEMHQLEAELRLSDAVLSAAQAMGLREIGSESLIDVRPLEWPITPLARVSQPGLSVTRERS